MLEAYFMFIKEHAGIVVANKLVTMSYTVFRSEWPYWVKVVKARNFCFCYYELNGQDYLLQLANFRINVWHKSTDGELPTWWKIDDPRKMLDQV